MSGAPVTASLAVKTTTLSAPQFYSAIEGTGAVAPSHVLEPLPFYHRVNMFAVDGQPETRTFVAAHLDDTCPTRIVGLAELDTNPDNPAELWLFYVAVSPTHRGQRIGAALLKAVVDFARKSGQTLSVSYPTPLSKERGFQAHLKAVLDASGVPWTQSR